MSHSGVVKIKVAAVAMASALLAACGAEPPPPPVVVAPPPPPPVVIPPRPTAPAGAFATMAIPQMAADGVRQTVNYGISSEQKLWNVRSGLNVAALNCLQVEHAALVENYRTFLKRHKRQLSRTNRNLAAEYRKQHGRSYRNAQDEYMTRVYNYFALPPALPDFCNIAHEISQEIVDVPVGELQTFAETNALPRMEAVYEQFFSAYEQYRVDLAAWEAQYGPKPPATMEANYGPAPEPAEGPEAN